MIVVVIHCSNCSRYIHAGKYFGEACIYCGMELVFFSEEKNSLLMEAINSGESELPLGKFSAAVKKYDEFIDKFPNISMLYWGRFLALHECKNDLELIINGVVFDTDPDYVNATRFANDTEKECYTTLAQTRNNIAKLVLSSLASVENMELVDTGIVVANKKAISEINELQNTITRQLSELDLIEKGIRDKVADCDVLVGIGKSRINNHVSRLAAIKDEINNLSEATDTETENYITEMYLSLTVCTNEWKAIQELSNNHCFIEYTSLLKQQKAAEQSINTTIQHINQVNDRLSQLIYTITSIKERHNEARIDIEKGSFEKAKKLLCGDMFEQISRKYVKS